MSLILFILTCCGLTTILTDSKLFEPFRKWVDSKSEFFGYLVGCPMCSSVYVGVGLSFLPCWAGAIPWYVAGFIASACAYMYKCITIKLLEE